VSQVHLVDWIHAAVGADPLPGVRATALVPGYCRPGGCRAPADGEE